MFTCYLFEYCINKPNTDAKNGKHVIVTGCFTGTDPKVAMELGNTIVTQAGETPMLERFEDSKG